MTTKKFHGLFSVEIYLRLQCPSCSSPLKRRVVDYLTNRASSCPNCSAKIVHLARGRTSTNDQMDLQGLKHFMEELESQWTSLVNESITMESSGFEIEP